MIKTNGSKLLKVFFILLALLVLYLLFSKNSVNASTEISFPYDYKNYNIKTTNNEYNTVDFDYFDYTFYDSYNDIYVTMPFPNNGGYLYSGGSYAHKGYKIIGITCSTYTSGVTYPNLNPIIGLQYNYICIPLEDNSHPYNNYFCIGNRASAQVYLPIYYINNKYVNYKFTEFKFFGASYHTDEKQINLNYQTSNENLAVYIEKDKNNNYIGLVRPFDSIYKLNWNNSTSSWDLGDKETAGVTYPNPIQYLSFDFSSPAYDLSNLGKGENNGFSFEVKHYDSSLMPQNLFIKLCIYKEDISNENENNYLYDVYLLPLYINNNWLYNLLNVQSISGGSDTLYGNVLSNYFVYSGFVNDINRNQQIVCFFDIEDVNSGKYFDIKYVDNNDLRYVCHSSYSPQDLYNIVSTLQYGSYNNFDKIIFTTPNYTDEELSNKKYNNLIDNIDQIINSNNLNTTQAQNTLSQYEQFYESMGIDINTGIPSIFENLKNAFLNENTNDINLTLPFVDTNIVLSQSTISNYYPPIVVTFVNMFWWGVIGLFILLKIYKIILNIKNGHIDKDNSDKIYENLL